MSGARDIRHAPDALALKVASKALVRAAGGGEGAGATCGVRQQRMSDCGNPNTVDFLRIDEVACLEDVTVGAVNHPVVTRALARRQGFELVKLPDAVPASTDLLKLLAEQAKESGELANAILAALGDQKLSAREAQDALAEADDLIAVAVTIRAALCALAAGEGQ